MVRLINETNYIWRVDVPGLRAITGEKYDLKIVDSSGAENIATNLAPMAYDRTGYAFSPDSRYALPQAGIMRTAWLGMMR